MIRSDFEFSFFLPGGGGDFFSPLFFKRKIHLPPIWIFRFQPFVGRSSLGFTTHLLVSICRISLLTKKCIEGRVPGRSFQTSPQGEASNFGESTVGRERSIQKGGWCQKSGDHQLIWYLCICIYINIPLFIGFYTSQVVQDFHQEYVSFYLFWGDGMVS